MSGVDESPVRPFTSRMEERPVAPARANVSFAATPSSSSITYATAEKIKTPPPAPYSGVNATPATLRQWIASSNIYFDTVRIGEGLDADEERVRRAASFLSGLAAMWYWNVYRPTRPQNHPSPWQHFLDALKKRWEPVDVSQAARISLRTFAQGEKSVIQYSEDFSALIGVIDDMTEADQIDKYVLGLRSDIRAHVLLNQAPTLAANMALAVRAENSIDIIAQSNVNAVVQRASTIQLGSMRHVDSRSNKLGKLSDTERQRLIASGGCFRCRKEGHWGKDCPTFPSKE